MIRHLFPNGNVERGNGKPGYRWVPAYSQITENGYSMPMTRREWQNVSFGHDTCLFHTDEQQARTALEQFKAVQAILSVGSVFKLVPDTKQRITRIATAGKTTATPEAIQRAENECYACGHKLPSVGVKVG